MSVLDRYRDLFRPDEIAREREAEDAKDVRQCVTTKAFAELRKRMQRKVEEQQWRPGMSQEEAAATLIAQTITLQLVAELDRMHEVATETVDVS